MVGRLSRRACNLILLVVVGCAAHPTGPLAAPPLMYTVNALVAFDGREAGTPNERAAADYIVARLRRAGLTPVEQPFDRSVNVYAVAPGFHDTDMTQGLADTQRAQIARRSALRKLPAVGDIAEAVEFLLGDRSASITGTVLTVDAGSTA